MVWKKRFFAIATLVLLVAILSGLMVSPALGQQPERVKVLIGFTRQPGPAEEALVHRAGGTIKYTYHLVSAIAATLPEAAIPGLLANPNVTRIEPDGKVWAIDAELDNTWGVKRIGAGVVHAYNKGTGVKVAIIDSGIDYTHEDLDANYKDGYDFVNKDADPMDDHGHGTHVAGTVAAEDNDIDTSVVGVAPEAQLYALKVLGADGGGSYSDVIAALEWAVDYGMQVTNNSYGSSGDPGETVKVAFDKAYAAGVLNVCAAGNSGNRGGGGDNVIYPARYESCIAVAATDSNDNRASFSSTGPDVELAAPGVNINSTVLGGGYQDGWNGTSMASPHVAGTAALVIATGITDANGDGNINDEVRLRLIDTADDLGDPGRDTHYGYGLVDADEAAPDTTPSEPTHDVAVISINVPSTVGKGDIVAVDVTVANEGTYDETFILTLTDETDVVTIGSATVSLAAGGSTTITFDWDTTDSSLGDHQLKAEASVVDGETDTADNVKTATVSVVEKKALYVAITTDKATYSRGETVLITVTVTCGGNPVEGATAHITILTPKPISYGWDQTTDANGVTVFEFTPKWSGDYTTWADASKEGYDSGSSEQITFTVE